MKYIYLYPATLILILLTGLAIAGCADNKDDTARMGLSIKVYSPTKVVEGQKVMITGTGLGSVTEVVFPGNIPVSAIEATSDNMISVITPAGIPAEGGQLSVRAGDETAIADIPLTVANPRYTAMTPSAKAGGGDELLIVGYDMEFFEKVIFPGDNGDVTMDAVDFERRSTSLLRIIIPRGSGIKEGPGRIRLAMASGKEILLPEMELTAGPSGQWEWVESTVWEGEHDLDGWAQNFYIEVAWFSETPASGDIVKFYFNVYAYDGWPQMMFNHGDWSSAYIEGMDNGNTINKNNYLTDKDVSEYELPPLDEEGLLPWFTGAKGSNALVINGEGVTFTKIALLKQKWVEF
ncbi:MAG: IPT/TIG domain-containing protein [Tannerellaceae bacterium]|nr:IPT/TIG domain-containing protein [Tannerellaceae bacterium]